jgi:hypothetical protein
MEAAMRSGRAARLENSSANGDPCAWTVSGFDLRTPVKPTGAVLIAAPVHTHLACTQGDRAL